MTFDLAEYLSTIDHAGSWRVQKLAGGNINVTYRATRDFKVRGANAGESRFDGYDSLIIKYAHPYVAAKGEEAPLTTYRQSIEARALSLFLPNNIESLQCITELSDVEVPTMIFHDPDTHVLMLKDLGDRHSLAQLFSALGGTSTNSETAASIDATHESTPLSYFSDIGSRIGSFLAYLHRPLSLQALRKDPKRGMKYLENPELGGFNFEQGIKPIKDHLLLFPHIVDVKEAESLFERIRGVAKGMEAGEVGLTMSDCWPGSILLSPPNHKNEVKTQLAMIDWEFAGTGCGLYRDFSQMLAHLALINTVAKHNRKDEYERQSNTAAKAMMQAYRKISSDEGMEWVSRPSAHGIIELDPVGPRVEVLRSTLMGHGMEIMRCAWSKSWYCADPTCMTGHEHTADKTKCGTVSAMVERAVWYFRIAQENVEEFCSQDNCSRMTQAQREGHWLLELM